MTWSSSPGANQPADSHDADQWATAELLVEGMHCGSCVTLIQEILAEQSGVESADVRLESARAVVEYDPGVIGSDRLLAAIADVGYTATVVG